MKTAKEKGGIIHPYDCTHALADIYKNVFASQIEKHDEETYKKPFRATKLAMRKAKRYNDYSLYLRQRQRYMDSNGGHGIRMKYMYDMFLLELSLGLTSYIPLTEYQDRLKTYVNNLAKDKPIDIEYFNRTVVMSQFENWLNRSHLSRVGTQKDKY